MVRRQGRSQADSVVWPARPTVTPDPTDNDRPAITLSMAEVGRRVRLHGIDAGRGLRARLAAMGIVPGVELDVISNHHHGAFVIGVRNSRIVLGRGMAHKILVR